MMGDLVEWVCFVVVIVCVDIGFRFCYEFW